jgi:hypothetical protein
VAQESGAASEEYDAAEQLLGYLEVGQHRTACPRPVERQSFAEHFGRDATQSLEQR